MGALLKLFDTVLFLSFLIDLKNQYIRHLGDYLMAETPPFFMGLLWLELLFQWLHTTCLIYGVSLFSSLLFSAMAAIAAELIGSQRASDILLKMYLPFLALGALATLRGLLPRSTGHRPRRWDHQSAQKRRLEEKKWHLVLMPPLSLILPLFHFVLPSNCVAYVFLYNNLLI